MRVQQYVNLRLHQRLSSQHIIATMMAGLGWSISIRPDMSIAQFMGYYLGLLGITNQGFGLIMLLCAVIIAEGPTHGNFILFTTPFLAYIAFGIMYFFATPGAPPGFVFIYAGTYGLMITHYFARHHDPNARSGQ